MKLMYCRECRDVQAVRRVPARRWCACGKSSAWLLDVIHIGTEGPVTLFGFFNEDIAEAVAMSRRLTTHWLARCHAIPPLGWGCGGTGPCQVCQGRTPRDAWKAHMAIAQPLPKPIDAERPGILNLGAGAAKRPRPRARRASR